MRSDLDWKGKGRKRDRGLRWEWKLSFDQWGTVLDLTTGKAREKKSCFARAFLSLRPALNAIDGWCKVLQPRLSLTAPVSLESLAAPFPALMLDMRLGVSGSPTVVKT